MSKHNKKSVPRIRFIEDQKVQNSIIWYYVCLEADNSKLWVAKDYLVKLPDNKMCIDRYETLINMNLDQICEQESVAPTCQMPKKLLKRNEPDLNKQYREQNKNKKSQKVQSQISPTSPTSPHQSKINLKYSYLQNKSKNKNYITKEEGEGKGEINGKQIQILQARINLHLDHHVDFLIVGTNGENQWVDGAVVKQLYPQHVICFYQSKIVWNCS